jgi:hypothetical protein
MPDKRVFVDTNVIIEAHRVGCWNAICGSYSVETVEKCVEESSSGNPEEPGYVHVPTDELRERLTQIHQVTLQEVASLILSHSECYVLDDGEKHLFARLYADQTLPSSTILVSTPDKAALKAAYELGWLDCWVSLDVLARDAGVGKSVLGQLRTQYQDNWLSNTKTKILLGVLP